MMATNATSLYQLETDEDEQTAAAPNAASVFSYEPYILEPETANALAPASGRADLGFARPRFGYYYDLSIGEPWGQPS